MRKFYWLLVFALTFVLSNCGEDEDGIATPTTPPPAASDNIAPQITIYSPQNDETYLAIGRVAIYALAKDNNDIKKVKMFLADPLGKRKPIDILDTGREDDGTGEYITQFLYPGGSVSGVYTLIVEAEDFNKNATSDSVQLNIIAEDLSKIDFKTAFTSTGWFESMGCCSKVWDDQTFNYAFYSIINKNEWDYYIDPGYVNEFGDDFGGHSQLWSTWDTNKNDYLEYSEFKKGLDDLNFITDWDVNKDNLISKVELADGVGKLWDMNKDNVVTAAEFEPKLMKYFLFD